MNENIILPVVLAGGKSIRFGKDKSIVKLGSKTLLEHTIAKLEKKFLVRNLTNIQIKDFMIKLFI